MSDDRYYDDDGHVDVVDLEPEPGDKVAVVWRAHPGWASQNKPGVWIWNRTDAVFRGYRNRPVVAADGHSGQRRQLVLSLAVMIGVDDNQQPVHGLADVFVDEADVMWWGPVEEMQQKLVTIATPDQLPA